MLSDRNPSCGNLFHSRCVCDVQYLEGGGVKTCVVQSKVLHVDGLER